MPNVRGLRPRVFAPANGLAAAGSLSAAVVDWWRDGNVRASQAYVDSTRVRSHCSDAVVNPGARSWLTESVVDLTELACAYLRLLDHNIVAWVELRT